MKTAEAAGPQASGVCFSYVMYVASCVGQPVKLGTGAATAAAGAVSMRGTMQYALSVESTPCRQLGPDVVFALASPRMQITSGVVPSPEKPTESEPPMTVRTPASHLYRVGAGSMRKPEVYTQLLPFSAASAEAQ